MAKLRVLICEDSLTVRKHLVDVCQRDPDLEVVGEVDDGKQAIEACVALRPDVVTMDMILPVISGLAATEYIMAYCPTPILVVSSSVNRGEILKTYDALAAGAVDVLDKPDGREAEGAWERQFLSALKMVSRIRVITHPRAKFAGRAALLGERTGTPAPSPTASEAAPPLAASPPDLSESRPARAIAIGVSTGGPSVLTKLFAALPRDFPLPILLVIHLNRTFASSLASWLDSQSSLRVAYVEDGDPLPPVGRGQVLMAPPDRHLELSHGRLRLTDGPELFSCKPSVDVLFESVARELGPAAVGCLLSGMGRDGASGLLSIRHAGGRTFAQDEATSVVFGMPREAILLGAAEEVLSIDALAPALCRIPSRSGQGG